MKSSWAKTSNKIIVLGPDNNSFGGIATCINNIVNIG